PAHEEDLLIVLRRSSCKHWPPAVEASCAVVAERRTSGNANAKRRAKQQAAPLATGAVRVGLADVAANAHPIRQAAARALQAPAELIIAERLPSQDAAQSLADGPGFSDTGGNRHLGTIGKRALGKHRIGAARLCVGITRIRG